MIRKRSVEGFFLGLVFWLISVMAVVFAARRWLPPLASEHGAGIDRMITYLIITVGTLIVAGHIVLGYFVFRFGRQERVTFRLASAKTEHRISLVLVALMALVTEGGVLVFGLPVWEKIYAAAVPAEAITIEVTGEQFAWNMRYPGKDGKFGRTDPNLITDENVLGLDKNDPAGKDDIVLRRVVVPVNRPVRIRLRSKDTLHSFFLPNFRVKQDAVPGMTMEFWFVPTVTGEYEIACAELCGFGHFQMRGLFIVATEAEFEKWLSEQPAFF